MPKKTNTASKAKRPLLIITGLSGAGMTSVLKALEDEGYQAIDNLPPVFLLPLLEEKTYLKKPLAIVIDSRAIDFSTRQLMTVMQQIKARGHDDVTLLYVDCDDQELLRRFTETRRRHPQAHEKPLLDGIQAERTLLMPLSHVADEHLDTTKYSQPELRRLVSSRFRLKDRHKMHIHILSFGFKKGLPRDADMVLDVRFLINPHHDLALRPYSGCDSRIQKYVQKDEDYKEFMRTTKDMLSLVLPRYAEGGRAYFSLAIGCTGGQHRSVTVSEALYAQLRTLYPHVTLQHRDVVLYQKEKTRKK